MLENRVPAPRAALVQYRVPACAHTRIRAYARAAPACDAACGEIPLDNESCFQPCAKQFRLVDRGS